MPPARRSTRTASTAATQPPTQPYTRANTRHSPAPTRPTASISRPGNGKNGGGLRLTVKAQPSKLRQATSGSQINTPTIPPNPYADAPSESDATPQPAVRTARSTRNPRTVVEPESDTMDEDAEEEEPQDEEMEGGVEADIDQEILEHEDSEDEEDEEEDDEEDAEGEEDEDMADHPPPPVITQTNANGASKPNVTVIAPHEGPLKSVEAKEQDLAAEGDEDEDDELSELDSNENENDNENGEEDDDDASTDGSRSGTPDMSKLTRRQRGIYEDLDGGSLLSLSNEAQKKKHLTAEEHAMRRAEMARRRKNLSEKRNEEEKVSFQPHPAPTHLTTQVLTCVRVKL